MDVINQLHFIRPYWLLGIIPVAILLFILAHNKTKANTWQQVCDPHLLQHLLVDFNGTKQHLPMLILGLAWLTTVFALAGPSLTKSPHLIYLNKQPQVIALGLTASMLSKDIPPSRLQRAKYKIRDLLERSHNAQTGLIVFSSEPFLVTPLTQDNKTINNLLPTLTPTLLPVEGYNLSAALNFAAKLFEQAGESFGSILLVTDTAADTKAIALAKKMSSFGIHVNVLGVGSDEPEPIPDLHGGYLRDGSQHLVMNRFNPKSLQQLAKAGRGIFTRLTTNDSDVELLLSTLHRQQYSQQSELLDSKANLWLDQGRWLLLLILPLVLLGFRRGWFDEVIK